MRHRCSRPSRRSYGSRPTVEGLESRQLLAVTITAYPLPANVFAAPNSITVGPDGNLWFATPGTSGYGQPGVVGVINPTTGAITDYPLPNQGGGYYGASASSIVSGPGGDLWFIEASSSIASVNPTTGAITGYPISNKYVTAAGLAVGSDGNLWFTDSTNGAIGSFNPTTHVSTEFPLPDVADVPGSITPGPDGHLWFTVQLPASSIYAIGDINPTTHAITLAELTNINAVPVSITTGPGGNLWFNEQFGFNYNNMSFKIASISPSTHAIAEYVGGSSGGITTGPDDNLWYDTAAPLGNYFGVQSSLGEFNPTTQVSSSYPVPIQGGAANPGPSIVTGPDDRIWFSAAGYIEAAQIVPADKGVITGTDVPNGTLFLDLMGDGRIDPGDPTVNADSRGNYTFFGLTPGTYTVRPAPFPGTIVSSPVGGGQVVTVAGGAVATAGPFTIVVTSTLQPLFYSATPFGASNPDVQTAEVNGLYRTILGRASDPAGGANAIAYLKQGGSLAQLSGDLLTSVEYEIDTVQSFYHIYLNRAASPPEQATGVSFLQGGGTQEQLAAMVLDSAEYSTLFATDTAFVQQIYIDVLGRSASAAEVSTLVNMLGTGTTRSSVVSSIIGSVESDTRVVSGLFSVIFAGGNSTPDQAAAVRELQGVYTPINLAVAYYSSPTFIMNANATVA